jgi:hypothetical protein
MDGSANRGSDDPQRRASAIPDINNSSVMANPYLGYAASIPTVTSSAHAAPGKIVPSEYDVLLGRGKGYDNHSGNKRFSRIIKQNTDRYNATASKLEKGRIAAEVVQMINSNGSRFLRFDLDSSEWEVVDDEAARVKTTQALRYQFRRSNTDKKSSRSRSRQQQQHNHGDGQDEGEGEEQERSDDNQDTDDK